MSFRIILVIIERLIPVFELKHFNMPASCLGCNDQIVDSELISCSGSCSSHFHYGCVGISAKSFAKMKTEQSLDSWKCIGCKHGPILDDIPNLNIPDIREKPTSLVPPKSIQDLFVHIQEENQSLKSYIKSQFKEYEKSLDFNSDLIKKLTSELTDLSSVVKTLKAQNEDLKRENFQIKEDLKQAQTEIADLQQYSRRTNLEITNLPESENENVTEVLTSVFSCLDINLIDQVSTAHRIPTSRKDKPKPIIVQFVNKQQRDTCLKAARAKKINASQVSDRFKKEPVYFNEHLIPKVKEVFYHCRKFKEANNYKFAWVKDGKIFIRENENSKVIRIVNTDDLLKLSVTH